MYYVFSVYYETALKFHHADFFMKSETYPNKRELMEIVKKYHPNAGEMVILGITQMSKSDFDLYWTD